MDKQKRTTCILVVAHKDFDHEELKEKEEYKIIKVGDLIDNESAKNKGWLSDSIGEDNISAANCYYCELTAIYYAWKYLCKEYDYIGICHYRRFFCTYHSNSKNIFEQIINRDEISKILKHKSAILPYPGIKEKGMFIPNREDCLFDQDINMGIVNEIIKKEYPQFLNAWEENIYGKIYTGKNMFITTNETFSKYCEFIFDILKKYDELMLIKDQTRIPRIDGFLAEYLTPTFFYTVFNKNNIACCDVRQTEKMNDSKSLREIIRRNLFISRMARKIQFYISRNTH